MATEKLDRRRVVKHGDLPCLTCGRIHDALKVTGRPERWGSWADPGDGHPYMPVTWEKLGRWALDHHAESLRKLGTL
jgi:hypothetical protein